MRRSVKQAFHLFILMTLISTAWLILSDNAVHSQWVAQVSSIDIIVYAQPMYCLHIYLTSTCQLSTLKSSQHPRGFQNVECDWGGHVIYYSSGIAIRKENLSEVVYVQVVMQWCDDPCSNTLCLLFSVSSNIIHANYHWDCKTKH